MKAKMAVENCATCGTPINDGEGVQFRGGHAFHPNCVPQTAMPFRALIWVLVIGSIWAFFVVSSLSVGPIESNPTNHLPVNAVAGAASDLMAAEHARRDCRSYENMLKTQRRIRDKQERERRRHLKALGITDFRREQVHPDPGPPDTRYDYR